MLILSVSVFTEKQARFNPSTHFSVLTVKGSGDPVPSVDKVTHA